MIQTTLTVLIPAFNEKDRLPPTLAEIEKFHKKFPGVISKVLIVDDGSTDGGRTVERAMRWMNRLPLRVDRLAENVGKWGAIHYGIGEATTDAILLMDADGSASIWELGRCKQFPEYYKQRVAIFGSRSIKGASTVGKSYLRHIVSEGYRMYVKFMYFLASGKLDVHDMQAPWKFFWRTSIMKELKVDRWAGDIELALALDCERVNHPLQFVHMRGSKVKPTAMISMALNTVGVVTGHWTWRRNIKKGVVKPIYESSKITNGK